LFVEGTSFGSAAFSGALYVEDFSSMFPFACIEMQAEASLDDEEDACLGLVGDTLLAGEAVDAGELLAYKSDSSDVGAAGGFPCLVVSVLSLGMSFCMSASRLATD
jgi:hypothetical protein